MIGSIIGDIVGSVFEYRNIFTTQFSFLDDNKDFTDDSIMTVATADWILHGGNIAEYYMRYGQQYRNPLGGYGHAFSNWLDIGRNGEIPPPYDSCGNGSAMRVGPVGWTSDNLEEILKIAKETADCTHNHPEGVKGAQAVSAAIFFARQGMEKEKILDEIQDRFGYDLSEDIESLRENYRRTDGNLTTCQLSVPQAIICGLKSNNFENAVRNAVSIGGDSDTIACICGAIAEPIYGVPREMRELAMDYLSTQFVEIVNEFETKYGAKII